MEKVIFSIESDVEGLLIVSIDDEVAWEVSDEFKTQILENLENHLGGDYSDEFDPIILNAIKTIKSCIKSSDLEDIEPPIHRVK